MFIRSEYCYNTIAGTYGAGKGKDLLLKSSNK